MQADLLDEVKPQTEDENEAKKHLRSQLIKLGDMMGDGLHHEPGGRWIEREYAKVLKALGHGPRRLNRSEVIDESMAKALSSALCSCGGKLKQTKKGALRAACVDCERKYQFQFPRKK